MEESPYLQIFMEKSQNYFCNIVAKNKNIVERLFEALEERNVSVPEFERQTGIKKDRVYKWKQEGTFPKVDDQEIIEGWLCMEKAPRETSTRPTDAQISPNSNYKDKYLALLESENLRLKNELSVSLVELHENLLVGKAMAATNQSMLIELLAKQRKESIDRVVSDANKLFDEFYRNMKAKDILPDGGR